MSSVLHLDFHWHTIRVHILTVSGGRHPRISIKALYICSAVPSKNLPQPATNSVSPAWKKKKHFLRALMVTHDRMLTSYRGCINTYWFRLYCLQYRSNVVRHTCENSWWLSAVFFCHIVADVTSRVTWCKQAFDIEWSKLAKNDTSEQTSAIWGLIFWL